MNKPDAVQPDLSIDLKQAQAFLDALEPGGKFTFQTFPEAAVRDEQPTSRPRVLHGTLDEHGNELTSLNMKGAGIFVMVNAGDGIPQSGSRTCRTAKNVVKVRANFVDLDGSPIEPILECELSANIIVSSSPGRWHAYWLVDGEELAEFSVLQKQLASRFKGDKSVNDLPRVMRLPGFNHMKAQPFPVRMTRCVAQGVGK